MRGPESFDAFYARTVAAVTSRMHEMAGGDPQADHAIREAYARAYQQWYEVSGYRDSEAWVLDIAREAFERRLSQSGHAPQPASRESGSWPNLFRPRKPAEPGPADPVATVAAPQRAAEPALQGPGPALAGAPLTVGPFHAEPPVLEQAADVSGVSMVGRGSVQPAVLDQGLGTYTGDPAALPRGGRGPAGRGLGGREPQWWHGVPGGSRTVLAGVVVAAVVVASVTYLALGGSHNGKPPRGAASTKPHVKPAVQMLGAGKTGSRSDIPWSLVGPGWALAEVSAAAPGSASAAGGSALYLVDPRGGKYLVRRWPGAAGPTLLAWSGDAQSAIFSTGSSGGYTIIALATGRVTPLHLPANVAVTGFTRPHGVNLLAVKQGPTRYQLVRYNLQGDFQAALASMPRDPNAPECGSACAALSSPTGIQAVWGAPGDEMQLVSNSGGIERRLHVPGSGHPPQWCTPISWWDASTVLANCSAAAGQGVATQLWLVPEDGSPGSPLTVASGSPGGVGFDIDAWKAGGQQYVTQTTTAACPGSPSGPSGLEILRPSSSGSNTPIAVPGSTGNHNVVVGAMGQRLLVLAQTSCPGSYSLLWLDPSTGTVQPLISAPANQAGVIAALPYGSGTAAAGN